MVDKRYTMFIEKLIEESKNNKMKWAYLDKEIGLCKGMSWAVDTRDIFSVMGEKVRIKRYDAENSFVTFRDRTAIVLFVKKNSTIPSLYVVPHTYRGVVKMGAEEYGEYITRLFNLVKSMFPHANRFIEGFIS